MVGRVKQVVVMDRDTGEVLESLPVLMYPKVRCREGFFMMFESKLKEIATDKTMTGESLRILFWMLSELSFENFILIDPAEIAESMGVNRPNVYRGLRVLVNKGLLVPGPKRSFKLSPTFAWKGKLKNRQNRQYEEILYGYKSQKAEYTRT